MAGDIHGITNLSNLSVAEQVSASTLSVVGAVAASTVTIAAGGFLTMTSAGTVKISTAHLSWRTISTAASMSSIAPSNVDNGVVSLAFAASGISLLYRSGNSVYVIGQSAQSAAAP
jgi:hypothetical protein